MLIMKKVSTFFGVFAILINFCLGLYFHIDETKRKCFIEEIPDETTVIVNYKAELYDPRSGGLLPSTGIAMNFEVRDPNAKTVVSRVYGSERNIYFTSHTPGEHVVCMYSNSTAWFNGSHLRVHLDIQVGERAVNYSEVIQRKKLSELELRVWQLVCQVEQITKEQDYQRYREDSFRQTSESTNSRVFWFSVTQTAILFVMGGWRSLKIKNEKILHSLTNFVLCAPLFYYILTLYR